jgi:hypothetical protein
MKFLWMWMSICLLAMGPLAKAGQESHGGDIAAAVFLTTAYELEQRLDTLSAADFPNDRLLVDYKRMIRAAFVSSEEHVYRQGVEVDAINIPDIDAPRVIVNRSRWLNPALNFEMRARLVFHEYLWLIGYDDDRYELSWRILSKIFKPTENTNNEEEK